MQDALAEFLWLLESSEAAELLAQAATATNAAAWQPPKSLSADRVQMIRQQVLLRRAAEKKFPQAARMFFTRERLEQSTDHWIAAYKANRFPAGALARDFCCGLGGDLLALANRGVANGGAAVGYDLDPMVARMAAANLRACTRAGTHSVGAAALTKDQDHAQNSAHQVHCQRASAQALTAGDHWHLDPDRRADSRRRVRVEVSSPTSAEILEMLRVSANAAIKLAPAAGLPQDWPRQCEREWISRHGECRQQVVWFGALTTSQELHRATEVDDSGQTRFSVVGTPQHVWSEASFCGPYLYEPNPAILAANLVAQVARPHHLQALTEGGGYLTGDEPHVHPGLAVYRVLKQLRLDNKLLRRRLRELEIGRLIIKRRGLKLDTTPIEKAVSPTGTKQATLVIARLGQQFRGFLCERVTDTGPTNG